MGFGCCDALTRAEIMTRRYFEMSAAYSRFGVACCPDLDNQKDNGLVSRDNSRYLWRNKSPNCCSYILVRGSPILQSNAILK
jgi:hypothetical protein